MAKVSPAKSGGPSSREALEELTFLKQQFGSLIMRGRYTECAKLIEGNLARLYTEERWPENFLAVLKSFQKCYPALNRSETLEEYLTALLKKNDIPYLLASFLRTPPPKWNGEVLREKTLEAKSAGRFEEAEAWCQLAVKMDPASSNLHLLLGWIYEDMEDGSRAVDMFQRALDLNENNNKASQGIARQYAKTNLKKAMNYIDEAMARFPDEAGFVAEKAALFLRMGKRDEAIATYDKAAEMDPYNPEYVYRKGELFLEDGKDVSAITQYKRAVALNSKHVPSLYRLAVLLEKKQPSAALEYITTVASQEPARVDAGLLRARMLRRTGDFDNAIRQYLVVLEHDENNVEALGGVARCYLRSDATRALEYYEKALALQNKADFHMGKAQALEYLKQIPEAIEEYKATVDLDRKNDRAFGRLGLLYREQEPQTALGYFDKAILAAPQNPEYHAERGRVLLVLDRHPEAVDSLNNASKLDPGNAPLHAELARELQKSGNRASAIKNYNDAVHLDPSIGFAHRGLAEMLLYSDPDLALSHINSAIGLDVANAEHYHLKSLIIAQFSENKHALDMLQKAQEASGDTEGSQSFDEISDLVQGNSLRVALMHINRAIELVPTNTTYLCTRAQFLARMGQNKKAMEEYERLLKSDPKNHEALYGMGTLLAMGPDKNGQHKKALEYFEKAIALSPATAHYHAKKAALLAQDPNRYPEAVACYDTAIALDTSAFEPLLEKARLLDCRGDVYPAMASYRRTLLVNRNCLPAAARLAELLWQARPDSALHYVTHAIFLDPDTLSHRILKAAILKAQEQTEAFDAAVEEALELGGESPEAFYELAFILAELFPETAFKYAVEAVEKAPEKGDYRFLLGNIHVSLGHLDEARTCYLEADPLGVTLGNAREKYVELLYLQGDPEALEAAETLPDTPECLLLKAKVYDAIADPPRTAEAIELLTAAIKQYDQNVPLRAQLVVLLQKKRALFRTPIEKAKLEKLRKKLEKEALEAFYVDEVIFDIEQATAELPDPNASSEDVSDTKEETASQQE